MADENTLRSYRANDPYGHESEPAGDYDHAPQDRHDRASGDEQAGHDPLAELARLIGQSDPFADLSRGHPRGGEGRDPSHFALGAAPSAPDWRRRETPSYDAPVQPDLHADYESEQRTPRFPPSTVPRHDHFSQDRSPQDRLPHDGLAMASTAGLPADPYGDPHDQIAAADRPYADDQYDAPFAAQDHGQDPYYEDEAPMGPQDEEMYDDAPNARRRGGIVTVITLVGCAMLGTAGAYGYRTYYVGAVPANPPVIVADKTPVKIVPPTDPQSSKAIQDRINDQGGEHIVSHEEQPVEIRPPGTQSAPRVVLPAPVAPMPNTAVAFPPPPATTATPAPAARPAPPTRSASSGEPKRVRTVTISPDGTDMSGRPVGGIGPAASSPPPRAAATTSRGGPLSLNPGAEEAPAAAPAPRAAPATHPAPRVASTAGTGSGGYMVQISSQRSEAEAHASFRAMKAKYSGVLGSHEGVVRRADLGAKGTYYRAMVGPFASASEAGQLCSQLKAAGGQCIIHRN